MKKCVNCGYEGEEILICPVCGGNMEHAETLQEEMKEDLEQYQMDVTADADDVKPEKKGLLPETLTRKEYWLRILVIWVAGWILAAIETAIVGENAGTGLISTAIWVCTIVMQIPRLKDAGKSKWWLLIDLLTIVGVIVIGCFRSADDRR